MKPLIPLLHCLAICIFSQALANPSPTAQATADDTPSAHQLAQAGDQLATEVSDVIKDFKTASKGKRWGRSPGHKATYQALLRYRQELLLLIDMCRPAESPDRLMIVVVDCEKLRKNSMSLAEFIIIPDALTTKIQSLKPAAATLVPKVNHYETRYFTWKKSVADTRMAQDMSRMRKELRQVQQNQQDIARQSQNILNEVSQNHSQPSTTTQTNHVVVERCPPQQPARPVCRPTPRPTPTPSPTPCAPTKPPVRVNPHQLQQHLNK